MLRPAALLPLLLITVANVAAGQVPAARDSIRMPQGMALVGMGDGVLYATREDADGLVYLQRYALP